MLTNSGWRVALLWAVCWFAACHNVEAFAQPNADMALSRNPLLQPLRGDVRGRVLLTPNGEPAAGIKVVMTGLKRESITDGRGEYSFAAVPAGIHLLEILDEQPGIYRPPVKVRVLRGRANAADLVMQGPQSVSGFVFDVESQQPVEGIRVQLSRGDRIYSTLNVTTRADGAFRFDVAPGRVQLNTLADRSKWVRSPQDDDFPWRQGEPNLQENQTVTGIRLALSPVKTPTTPGTVRLPDGSPARDARVTVQIRWLQIPVKDVPTLTSFEVSDGLVVRGREVGSIHSDFYPLSETFHVTTNPNGEFQAPLGDTREISSQTVKLVRFVTHLLAQSADGEFVGYAPEGEMSVQLQPAARLQLRLVDGAGRVAEQGQISLTDFTPIEAPPQARQRKLSDGSLVFGPLLPGVKHRASFVQDGQRWERDLVFRAGETTNLGDISWTMLTTPEQIIAGLSHSSPEIAVIACQRILELAEVPESAYQPLRELMNQPDQTQVNAWAAIALTRFGMRAENALLHVLDLSTPQERWPFLAALALIGSESGELNIRMDLLSSDPIVASNADSALTYLPDNRGPRLLMARLRRSPDQHFSILTALQSCGPAAGGISGDLLAYRQERPDLGNQIVPVLGAIAGPEIIPELENLIDELPRDDSFQEIVRAISQIQLRATSQTPDSDQRLIRLQKELKQRGLLKKLRFASN